MTKNILPCDQRMLDTIYAKPWLKIGSGQAFPTVEGACFDGDGFLFVGHREHPWSDILKVDTKNRRFEVFYHDDNASIIGLACHANGRVYACDINGRILEISKDGRLERDLLASAPKEFKPNDLCFDNKGNLYFSDFVGTPTKPTGGIYRFDMVEGYEILHLVAGDLCTPNGVSFSPDFGVLWTAETLKNDVVRISLNIDGYLSSHFTSVFATYHNSGYPHVDSSATDSEGNIYQCIMEGGRILVLNQDGIPVQNILLSDRDSGTCMKTPNVAISPYENKGYLLAAGTSGAWIYQFDSFSNSSPYFALLCQLKKYET